MTKNFASCANPKKTPALKELLEYGRIQSFTAIFISIIEFVVHWSPSPPQSHQYCVVSWKTTALLQPVDHPQFLEHLQWWREYYHEWKMNGSLGRFMKLPKILQYIVRPRHTNDNLYKNTCLFFIHIKYRDNLKSADQLRWASVYILYLSLKKLSSLLYYKDSCDFIICWTKQSQGPDLKGEYLKANPSKSWSNIYKSNLPYYAHIKTEEVKLDWH